MKEVNISCNKCCRTIRPSRVIIINKKLVCPYCFRTIETNISKSKFIEKVKESLKNNKEEN